MTGGYEEDARCFMLESTLTRAHRRLGDERGRVILGRRRVHSTCEGFKEALAGYDKPFKAVLEASYSWGPMYDWLNDMKRGSAARPSAEG